MKICLNEGWLLHEEPMNAKMYGTEKKMNAEPLKCSLPCDIHMPLIESGRLKDPVLADYSFHGEWTEQCAWWFVKSFNSDSIDSEADIAELTFDSIDSHADIFLNGVQIGSHESAFYPFVKDIKEMIRAGENEIAVRVTTGMETVTEQDLLEIGIGRSFVKGARSDGRRAYVRRPAYTVGWDWGPKALTCGIVRDAYIRAEKTAAIRNVKVFTKKIAGADAKIGVTIESELFSVRSTADADICIRILFGGKTVAEKKLEDVLLTSGVNFTDAFIKIENANLWWPNGCGGQPLYEAEVTLVCKDAACKRSETFGIRTVELNTERDGFGGRVFALTVNGVKIFCKGGNWIPADSIYARVSAEKYEKLITEAKAANFNMLRIWGGGIYEADAYYDACNRHGILVWHDFMGACEALPDHLDWYQNLVAKEFDYQTKRLRNNPCIALFCGNNEQHWLVHPLDQHWQRMDVNVRKQYGLYIANVTAVKAVRENCPHIPYWNSSPYGGENPNDYHTGDVHHWFPCMMNPDMEKRINPFEFDAAEPRFVSEYGYPGPCPIESIKEYFDGEPIDRAGKIWDHHNNTFEKDTVVAGIAKHLTEPSGLDLDGYIFYAGLVQSEMLNYSLEALRFKNYCAGALFWMYNDTWGEVGWTIIDYYLRRKISFFGVK
ncbi:MAG: beta-mannosidase, partial [Defluviitaleaceae bacterium]|nr:beta-mannosidase [Defluviitaleaceae bacterium]